MNAAGGLACSFCGRDERSVKQLYASRIGSSAICDSCVLDVTRVVTRDVDTQSTVGARRVNYIGWSWVLGVFPLAMFFWFGLIFNAAGSRANPIQVLVGIYVVVYGSFEVGRKLTRIAFDADRIAPLSWLLAGVLFGARVDQIGIAFGALVSLTIWGLFFAALRKYAH